MNIPEQWWVTVQTVTYLKFPVGHCYCQNLLWPTHVDYTSTEEKINVRSNFQVDWRIR